MIKKLTFLFFIIILAILIANFVKGSVLNNDEEEIKVFEEGLEHQDEPDEVRQDITVNNQYRADWIVVRDIKKIRLFNNLTEKLTSKEAQMQNMCLYLVSGGFYRDDDTHIGLMVIEGNMLSDKISNRTYNGFFYIKENRANISTHEPINPHYAIQTGPMLVVERRPQAISISNDKPARRIIAALNEHGHLIFIALYGKSSFLTGPLLSEAPDLLVEIDKNTSLSIVNAVNLDGGTHSAFLGEIRSLSEANPIGSYFCVKN